MEINILIKIEILLETTTLLPIKSVFYIFSVGALEQKTGENGDGSPVIHKLITVMENSLLFTFV